MPGNQSVEVMPFDDVVCRDAKRDLVVVFAPDILTSALLQPVRASRDLVYALTACALRTPADLLPAEAHAEDLSVVIGVSQYGRIVQMLDRRAAVVEPTTTPALTEPQVADKSSDLFLSRVVIEGKYFGFKDTYLAQSRDLFGNLTNTVAGQQTNGARTANVRGSAGLQRKKESDFWDILYPMLLPPLSERIVEQWDFPPGKEPRHYQWQGVEFLGKHPEALLADETGTGKTITAIVAIRVLLQKARIKRCLIVCPVAAIGVWVEHLLEWAPELRFEQVRGNSEARQRAWSSPAHVYITTYDTLRRDCAEKRVDEVCPADADLILLDEAQYIKNPEADRSKTVCSLRVKSRWALSATPLETRLDDIAAIFRFIKPGLVPMGVTSSGWIKERIEPYTLRRTKKQVRPDMPDKIPSDIWLDLSSEQRELYDAVRHREIAKLEELGEHVTRVHVFAVITKLKQICNFMPGTSDGPKTDAMLDKVEELQQDDDKVLIFSQWIAEGVEKISSILHKKGVEHVVCKGGMTDHQRDQVQSRFKQDPGVVAFIGQVRAAGISLNLQEATHVIHFDHWWNPAVMWQAEDRAYRINSERSVNVYRFWMKDTIEERIYRKLHERGLLFQEVFGAMSVQQMEQTIGLDEWLDILGVRPTKTPSRDTTRATMDSQELMASVRAASPELFEHIVAALFRGLGYVNARVTPRSHDGGVDVIATKASLGSTERIVAQCKRMDVVGVEHARELLGVISSDTAVSKGFLVTSGRFSNECQAFCQHDGRLACIDGARLVSMLRQFGIDPRHP